MASALYPSFKELLLGGDIDLVGDDVRAILIDTGEYTYDAEHEMLDDVPGPARVAVSGALASKDISGGVFDAADTIFTSVTGNPVEAIVLYKHTGTDATSPLIAYIDGFSPVTPNGGDITAQWDAAGIFAL